MAESIDCTLICGDARADWKFEKATEAAAALNAITELASNSFKLKDIKFSKVKDEDTLNEAEAIADAAKFHEVCSAGAADAAINKLFFLVEGTELVFGVKTDLNAVDCKEEVSFSISKKLNLDQADQWQPHWDQLVQSLRDKLKLDQAADWSQTYDLFDSQNNKKVSNVGEFVAIFKENAGAESIAFNAKFKELPTVECVQIYANEPKQRVSWTFDRAAHTADDNAKNGAFEALKQLVSSTFVIKDVTLSKLKNEDNLQEKEVQIENGAKLSEICLNAANRAVRTIYFVVEGTEQTFQLKANLGEADCNEEVTLSVSKKLDVSNENSWDQSWQDLTRQICEKLNEAPDTWRQRYILSFPKSNTTITTITEFVAVFKDNASDDVMEFRVAFKKLDQVVCVLSREQHQAEWTFTRSAHEADANATFEQFIACARDNFLIKDARTTRTKPEPNEEVTDGAKLVQICIAAADKAVSRLEFSVQGTDLTYELNIDLGAAECKEELKLSILQSTDVTQHEPWEELLERINIGIGEKLQRPDNAWKLRYELFDTTRERRIESYDDLMGTFDKNNYNPPLTGTEGNGVERIEFGIKQKNAFYELPRVETSEEIETKHKNEDVYKPQLQESDEMNAKIDAKSAILSEWNKNTRTLVEFGGEGSSSVSPGSSGATGAPGAASDTVASGNVEQTAGAPDATGTDAAAPKAAADAPNAADAADAGAERTDDDQKEGAIAALYKKCNEISAIIETQTERLENVEDHAPGVFVLRRDLSKKISENQAKIARYNEEKIETDANYDQVQKQRIDKEKELSDIFRECCERIGEENRLLFEKFNITELLKKEETELETNKKYCNAAIKCISEFSEFRDRNENSIELSLQTMENKWMDLESKWWTWNVDDILLWIRYRLADLRYNTIKDLNDETKMQAIGAKMKEQGITGESIQSMDRRDLADFGFTNFNLRIEIEKSIRVLCEKHPWEGSGEPSKDATMDPKQTSKQPSLAKAPSQEFLCPLTKELMQDPVIAFDGETYERANIVKYLKEHKKSPTGETVDDERTLNILFPNRSLKKKIVAYRLVNDPNGQNYGMVDVE